jgi:hypothetical protein
LNYTVCLKKKRATFISSKISLVTKDIYLNFRYFASFLILNEMACSNFPGKISLKLEMKSSRNSAFFNQKISVSNG